DAAIPRRRVPFPVSAVSHAGGGAAATRLRATARTSPPPRESLRAGAWRNDGSPESDRPRNPAPRAAANDFGEYEMAGDPPLVLPCRAIAKARARRRTCGRPASPPP